MPMDATTSQLLAELHEALDAMQNERDLQHHGATGPFLSRLFHVGARLHREPDLLDLDNEEVQRLLRRGTSPHLRFGAHIHAFARELADLLQDSWEIGTSTGVFVDHRARACTERSSLEFALEFFPGFFSPSERDELLKTLALADDLLKAKLDGGDYAPHPEQTPAGVPLSHPWWNYKGE